VGERPEITLEMVCEVLYDLSGRGGMDEALDACFQFMDPADVAVLDAAIELGRLRVLSGEDSP